MSYGVLLCRVDVKCPMISLISRLRPSGTGLVHPLRDHVAQDLQLCGEMASTALLGSQQTTRGFALCLIGPSLSCQEMGAKLKRYYLVIELELGKSGQCWTAWDSMTILNLQRDDPSSYSYRLSHRSGITTPFFDEPFRPVVFDCYISWEGPPLIYVMSGYRGVSTVSESV